MRTRLLLLPAALAALVVVAGPGAAQTATVTDLADDLRRDQVVLEPGADVPLDEDAVRDAVRGSEVQIYVAGVSEATAAAAGGGPQLVQQIGSTIGDTDAVVLVITDKPSAYANNGRGIGARGVNAGEALRQVNTRSSFDEASVTGLVRDFVSAVDRQANGGSSSGSGSSGSSGSGKGLLAVLGLGALGAGGYAAVRSRRRKREDQLALEDARADVESLYGRLGSDVQLLAPGDDAVARQALADAAERYTATGALMAKADTPGEFAAARRTAVEGLAAARVVRQRLGLDPGPDIPMPEGNTPKLTQPSRVRVGDDEYDGSPDYEPGRPHYYEGGYYGGQAVPAGWYATPFWQSMLLTSVMSSGWRGGGYGGGWSGGVGGGSFGGGWRGGGLGGGWRGGGGGGRSGGFGGFGGGGGWGGGGGGGRRGGGGGW